MDLLIIANIFDKFTAMVLNSKCDSDINKFLVDPFTIDLNHLNTFYLQLGGAATATAAPAATAAAATAATAAATMANNPEAAEAATEAAEASNGSPSAAQMEMAEKLGKKLNFKALENKKSKSFRSKVWNQKMTIDGVDDPNKGAGALFEVLVRWLIYPFIIIGLAIYPYIYVTYTSFYKILSSYRENVQTM